MRVKTSAVLLLLHLHLLLIHLSTADRVNDKVSQNQEARARRHETEERQSGRRWTTSRNSPYQKIVSSYEQAAPELREAEGDAELETQDQAKAKTVKRKQWRTSAPVHDQIASETSSTGESGDVGGDDEGSDPEAEEQKEVKRTPRRRSTTSHPQETSSEPPITTTSNPKKRRRPSTTTTTTTHPPQTMSDSLYQYFRPLEQDVPQDDIIPFLDFGRKLSPAIPTPSGANSIENRSMVTKLRSRGHHVYHEEKESNTSDEDILQEDMDVTVVKKAIERNSVPRGKLRIQSSGISDSYRKRVPAQIRTTENLISTSDSSTVSSVPGHKNIGVLKKINRHQVHHVEPSRIEQKVPLKNSPDLESASIPKDVELFQEKRKQTSVRQIHRSAALKQDTHTSPLTAESSVVKTVIKEVPEDVSSEPEFKNTTTAVPNIVNANVTNVSENQNSPSLPKQIENDPVINQRQQNSAANKNDKLNPKILSTAVVTSVSVQESLKSPQQENATVTPGVNSNKSLNHTHNDHSQNFTTQGNKTSPPLEPQVKHFIHVKNNSNSVSTDSSSLRSNKNITTVDQKNSTFRNITAPAISRDIYRQRNPARIPIHLPRQLSRANSTQVTSPPTESSVRNVTVSPLGNNTNLTSLVNATLIAVKNTTTTPRTTTTTIPTTVPTLTSTTTNKPTLQTTEKEEIKHPKPTPVPAVTTSEEPHYVEVKNISNVPHFKYIPISSPTSVDSTKYEESVGRNVTETDASPGEHNKEHSEEVIPSETHTNHPEKDEHAYQEEAVSIPPPNHEESSEKISFVSVQPPEESDDDQFPIFFTTPTPVVDTRPDPEVAVVQEQKNSSTSTSRPSEVTDWVKASEVNKEVEVVYPESLGLGTYLLAALGVVPVIVGALIGARFIMAHNRKKVLDESEYSSEYNRSPLGISTSSPLPTKLPRIPTHVSWSEREQEKPPLPATPVSTPSSRWEFPREKLRLQTLLGQGNFGQVWKAEADDIAGHEGLTRLVAVKTVKESATAREREDLLRELGIMQELGSHPNVVTLLGCCTEKEPIYLMMEYVMYGKLLSFLRDHRTRAHYYNFSDATDALTSRDLTVFGYCVARGMDYLSNKSIIHRDLAARNVLVDHNKLCKIADFGMSRNVRDTGQIYEQRQSKGALPIRWMAPESLHFSLFTHKTDVWSFGILMWEIVTLGSTPYSTMGAREVMRRVRDGYRLDRPSHCRPELFRVIARCWHSEPSKRPTFAELKAELAQLLSDPELNGSFVDLDSFADEMRRDTLHRHH